MRNLLLVLAASSWLADTAFAQVAHKGMPKPHPMGMREAFLNGLAPTNPAAHPGGHYAEGFAEDGGFAGIAMSPDGRVVLFPLVAYPNGCNAETGLYVSVLRHESLQLDAAGQPDFTPSGGTAWIDRSRSTRWRSAAPHRHSASSQTPIPCGSTTGKRSCPDPEFQHLPCPYPSDVNGTYSAGSTQYETYRMLVLAADDWRVENGKSVDMDTPALVLPSGGSYCPITDGTTPPSLPQNQTHTLNPIGRRYLQVVVQNPHSTTPSAPASIVRNSNSTWMSRSFEVLWFMADENTQEERPLLGIEPTITMDGRLLMFQSSPNNFGSDWDTRQGEIDRLMFSWNPDGGAVHGWSAPQSIANLHDYVTTDVAGVPMGERYPIASQPLLEMEGTPLQDLDPSQSPSFKSGVAGAYPWITLDGTDLFFTTTNDSTRTQTVCMIGSSTHWRLRHIDGPMNPTRGGLGTAGGFDGFHHRNMGGTGLSPGAWAWGRNGTTPLPFSPALRTMSMVTGRTREYIEVSVEAGLDPDIIVAFDMNAGVAGLDLGSVTDIQEDWGLDPGWTGNTAKSGAPAWLQGDAHLTEATTAHPEVLYDGAIGDCVTFTESGYIIVAPHTEVDQALERATISFWIRQEGADSGVGDRRVVEKAGSYQVLVDGVGNLTATVWQTNSSSTQLGPVAPANSGDELTWRHVALVFDGPRSKLTMWVDGNDTHEVLLAGSGPYSIAGSSAWLHMGPQGDAGTDETAFSLDQFRIDRVARDHGEICRLAHVDEPAVTQASLPSWFTTALSNIGRSSAGYSLPQGSVLTQSTVSLGEKLFADGGLSPHNVSCATCHIASLDFTDGNTTSLDFNGDPLLRNAPTVIDRLWSTKQFWDGRAEQLGGPGDFPVLPPSRDGLLGRLHRDLPADYGQRGQSRLQRALRDGLRHGYGAYGRPRGTSHRQLPACARVPAFGGGCMGSP